MLSGADILRANDRIVGEIEVPEWGGTVLLRRLSSRQIEQWDEFARQIRDPDTDLGPLDGLALMFAQMACDEQGEPLFTGADLEKLKDKAAEIMRTVVDRGAELNNIELTPDVTGDDRDTPGTSKTLQERAESKEGVNGGPEGND